MTQSPRLAAVDGFGEFELRGYDVQDFSAPELAEADNYVTEALLDAETDVHRLAWEAAHSRRVMEATGEGVLILTAEGICEYANPAAEQLLGWNRDWLVGQDVHTLLHPEHTHGCAFAKPFADALPSQQADVYRTSRGALLPVDVTVNPSLTNSLVDSVVCLFSDATARLRREREQAELLEAREEALARLEALTAQQRDFVSTVSHELRTPLTSIMGFLDIVMEQPDLDPETRENLVVVDRNAKRLLAQVEALLLVSRIESGKIGQQVTDVDLPALVADAVAAISTQADAKGVRVSVLTDPDLPVVRADANQLDRVLLNLLSNAVKFSRTGGDVEVEVTRHGDWVQVQVLDTGMGIPAEEQHRLFEKFFRSTISQKAATPGTGLGLAIVKAIVEEHGGRVRVLSEEGVGTAVAFTLPV